MKLPKKYPQKLKSKQKGFTLIELAVVSLFLGQLAIFAITTFSTSAPDGTKAKTFYDVTFKIANQWGQIVQLCNISSDITAVAVGADSVATTTARKNVALITGSSNAGVVAAYSACYKNSGAKPIRGAVTGSPGVERIIGYTISGVSLVSNSGRNYIAFGIATVPENIVLALYNKYSSTSGANTATVVPATANTTDPLFRFSVASSGTRTITFVQPI